MQRTEVISEKRPQRAVQVVPIEPALRHRRFFLISGAIILLSFSIAVFFIFTTAFGNTPLPGYELLWDHSIVAIFSFPYIIFSVRYIFSLARSTACNQRRQQAARYNLAVGVQSRAMAQPGPNASTLPDSFTITTRRHWGATYASIAGGIILLGFCGAGTYSSWQETLQFVQQGVPMALVILNNCFNLAILLLLTINLLIMLIFSPRQQLIATRDGLTYRQGYHIRHIPWPQARLFAIIDQASPEHGPALYELASQDALIRWPSHANSQFTPTNVMLSRSSLAQPISAAEFPQQVQFLNIIIAERTGLPLYDLR